jgi:ATP-dependent Clp protease ATP-binding subunit ClpB
MEKMTEKNREDVLDETKEEIIDLLKQTLRPEFYNRIDEVVMFNPLTKKELENIVRIQLTHLNHMLEKNEIKLHVSDDAMKWLCTRGYDPAFGARPVKRLIQKTVLNELSKSILGGKVKTGDLAVMDVIDDKVVFRKPIKQEEEIPFIG